MRHLPSFSKLIAAYPNQATPAEVFKLIGGKVEQNNFPNSCVICISCALNYSGDPIKHGAWALSVSGSDGKWYAFRVAEFTTYMTKEYGHPQVTVTAKDGKPPTDSKPFTGKPGIMAFEVAGWSNATGHFDLWDGLKCVHEAYFDKATRVMLWQAPA